MERKFFRDTDCLTARGRSEGPTVLRTDCLTSRGSSENPAIKTDVQPVLGQAALAIHMILNGASL